MSGAAWAVVVRLWIICEKLSRLSLVVIVRPSIVTVEVAPLLSSCCASW